jgi:hypothetical protein
MEPENVSSREDLAAFIRVLAAEAPNSGWENDDLGRYLEALSAWVDDMHGWFLNRGETPPEQPDWRLVAWMLRAATIYE